MPGPSASPSPGDKFTGATRNVWDRQPGFERARGWSLESGESVLEASQYQHDDVIMGRAALRREQSRIAIKQVRDEFAGQEAHLGAQSGDLNHCANADSTSFKAPRTPTPPESVSVSSGPRSRDESFSFGRRAARNAALSMMESFKRVVFGGRRRGTKGTYDGATASMPHDSAVLALADAGRPPQPPYTTDTHEYVPAGLSQAVGRNVGLGDLRPSMTIGVDGHSHMVGPRKFSVTRGTPSYVVSDWQLRDWWSACLGPCLRSCVPGVLPPVPSSAASSAQQSRVNAYRSTRSV